MFCIMDDIEKLVVAEIVFEWMAEKIYMLQQWIKYWNKIRYAQKLLIYRHFIQCSSCYKTVKYENAEQLFHGCWTVWNDFTLE